MHSGVEFFVVACAMKMAVAVEMAVTTAEMTMHWAPPCY
jgi:hypothetical protein